MYLGYYDFSFLIRVYVIRFSKIDTRDMNILYVKTLVRIHHDCTETERTLSLRSQESCATFQESDIRN